MSSQESLPFSLLSQSHTPRLVWESPAFGLHHFCLLLQPLPSPTHGTHTHTHTHTTTNTHTQGEDKEVFTSHLDFLIAIKNTWDHTMSILCLDIWWDLGCFQNDVSINMLI